MVFYPGGWICFPYQPSEARAQAPDPRPPLLPHNRPHPHSQSPNLPPPNPRTRPDELFFEVVQQERSHPVQPAESSGSELSLPPSLMAGLHSRRPIRRKPLPKPAAIKTQSLSRCPKVSPISFPEANRLADIPIVRSGETKDTKGQLDRKNLKPLPEPKTNAEMSDKVSQPPQMDVTQVDRLQGRSTTRPFRAEEFARIPGHYDFHRK